MRRRSVTTFSTIRSIGRRSPTGLEWTRRIVEAAPMNPYRGAELMPGPDVTGAEALLEFARRTAETAYHPVGTCKMGRDDMAVVDDRLRVHGLESLRIMDASIMPTLISGNTNAPSMMIGERGAEFLLTPAGVSSA